MIFLICQDFKKMENSPAVNLSVFLGKPHVLQVNRLWGSNTCGLQVNLPAFVGYFALAYNTV